MTLGLTALDHLRQTAESGSFAAAARVLGVSQPAVSQQVRRIESRYGVRLFVRRRGALEPTPLCLELCEAAERMRLEGQAAERLLTRSTSLDSGEISVGLGNTMPGMGVIARFHARYPGVGLRVESGSHERIMRAVFSEEVQVGILPDVPDDPRLTRSVVLQNHVVALLPARHRLAARPELSLPELAREALVFRARGSSTQRVVDRAMHRAGLSPEPILTLDTRDGVFEAVANGIGVGFIWNHATGRSDGVARVKVAALSTPVDEVAFTLADARTAVTEAFLEVAGRYGEG